MLHNEPLEQILGDSTSGSSRIVQNTLNVLSEAKEEDIREIFDKILRAHPSMAGLHKIRSLLKDHTVDEIRHRFQKMDRRTIQNGIDLLADKTLATISQSHTVEGILERAHKVYVLTSAPGKEGMETCNYLRNRGVETILTDDARMGQIMPQSDGVLVGADTLLPDSFINKVGTLPLALVADYFNIPLHVAASSYKRAEDIQPNDPFETIPSRLVDRYITEESDSN